MDKLRSLELFAGIGGFALGLEATGYFETVGFCENDPYARAVLRKHWPDVPQFGDIKELTVDQIKEKCGRIDIVTGGYPCQPYSQAGKRRGHEDDRDLWPEMFRIIKGLRPSRVLGENVVGHITLGLDRTISDLEAEGYAVRVFVIPACAVRAPHRRDRVWIVGHRIDAGLEGHAGNGSAEAGRAQPHGSASEASLRGRGGPDPDADLVDDDGGRYEASRDGGQFAAQAELSRGEICEPRWLPEPDVGRVAYGIPARVDRIKTLGNAVVPQVVARLGLAIAEAHRQEFPE